MSWPPEKPTARVLLKKPTDWPRAAAPPRALTIERITGPKPAANAA